MNYGYLVVEGHHDAEVIGKFLRRRNLTSVTKFDTLDQYWKPLVPKEFPPGGDLMKRVQVPLFFQNDRYSIAIQIAGGGLEEIKRKLEATIENYETLRRDVVGIGIIVDADYKHRGAKDKFKEFKKELVHSIRLPNTPGKVLDSKPKSGIFIFPDNKKPGTIEKMLLKCGHEMYPDILDGAEHFVNAINLNSLHAKDKEEFIRPAGKDKAIIGCVANILRPGKAVQVSIHDNGWISDQTIGIPEVADLNRFLEELFELP
jgi:hypothetical protein